MTFVLGCCLEASLYSTCASRGTSRDREIGELLPTSSTATRSNPPLATLSCCSREMPGGAAGQILMQRMIVFHPGQGSPFRGAGTLRNT
eukprot:s2194_g5.t1